MLSEPVCRGAKVYILYNPLFHYSLFRSSQLRRAVPAGGLNCRRRGASRENTAVLNRKNLQFVHILSPQNIII